MTKFDENKLKAVREIPLDVVFESFGATQQVRDAKNWQTQVGRISTDGEKFFNHDLNKGGVGAITLAMHLGDFSFTDALAHLGEEVGRERTVSQYIKEGSVHANRILEETKAPKPKLEIPKPNPEKLDRVKHYLIETRAISPEIVNKMIKGDRLWADNYGNCVFALRDPNLTGKSQGAELRGTYDKPFHAVRGEEKGVFFTGNAETKRAVFVESSIEAMSYETLAVKGIVEPALVVGSVGNNRDALAQAATNLKELGYEINSGFNQDKAGDALHKNLDELAGVDKKLIPGTAKDWNKMLVEIRDKERDVQREKSKTDLPRKKDTSPEIER